MSPLEGPDVVPRTRQLGRSRAIAALSVLAGGIVVLVAATMSGHPRNWADVVGPAVGGGWAVPVIPLMIWAWGDQRRFRRAIWIWVAVIAAVSVAFIAYSAAIDSCPSASWICRSI